MTTPGSCTRSETISAGGSEKTFASSVTSSAADGLATLRELGNEHKPLALLIVDHNLSEMPGVDFLARAHEMHPLAKRVLLVERATACAARWSRP